MKNKKSILLFPILLALPLYGGPSCNVSQKDGGIYKTANAGNDWNQIITIEESKDTLAKADTSQFLVDPNNPDVIFMITGDNNLYVSNHFGESWRRILPEAGAVYWIEGVPSQPGQFYASILLNDRAKIVKTENGGQDWLEVYTEPGKDSYVTQIKVNPFAPSSIIAANSEGLLIQSDDEGSTWKALYPFQELIFNYVYDPVNENFIWALTSQGLWLSRDGGLNFTQVELGQYGDMGTNYYLLRKYGANLFMATDKGFYQSLDNGTTWRKIIVLNNPTDYPVTDFAVVPENNGKWAMAAGMTLYLTSDAGQNWKPIQFDIDRNVNSIAIKPNDANQILVGVRTASKGALGF